MASHLYSKVFPVIILAVLFLPLAGCAKLEHLSELLTIKGLSEEQAEVNKYIELKNERFNMLYSIVKSGDIVKFTTARKVRKHFGEPIRFRPSPDNPLHSEWVYREQTRYFGSPTVYLYFDNDNKLVDWLALGDDDGKVEP